MRQVVNCLHISGKKALLLNKMRRGWWVAPGGKVEPNESLSEACAREFLEETGMILKESQLVSIFTVIIKNGENTVDEWMFYSFRAKTAVGTPLSENHEGKLRWIDLDEMLGLPMAEGDKVILDHAMNGKGIINGVVTYTEEYQLIDIRYTYC